MLYADQNLNQLSVIFPSAEQFHVVEEANLYKAGRWKKPKYNAKPDGYADWRGTNRQSNRAEEDI